MLDMAVTSSCSLGPGQDDVKRSGVSIEILEFACSTICQATAREYAKFNLVVELPAWLPQVRRKKDRHHESDDEDGKG